MIEGAIRKALGEKRFVVRDPEWHVDIYVAQEVFSSEEFFPRKKPAWPFSHVSRKPTSALVI